MEDNVTLGDRLYEKTDNILINTSCISTLSKSERIDKAIDLYKQAINYYKLAKSYNKIGQAHVKIAELECGYYQVASNYLEAAKNFAKVDKKKVVVCYKKASENFTKDGKFSSSARILETLGEIYKEDLLFSEAITSYEKAYDYYEIDNQHVAAHKCLLESAYLLIRCEKYEDAICHLKEASNYYSKTLVDFKCSQLYFDMIIIRMFSGDIVECNKLLNEHGTKVKDHMILRESITALENYDIDSFSQTILIYKLNNSWQLNLLSKIRERLDIEDDQL